MQDIVTFGGHMVISKSRLKTSELVEDLKRDVLGEVRFDDMTRMLYSTDASMYQIQPVGVVMPRTADDVVAVLELANRYKVPVLPRGGGTSLAGQTVGHAIVIDFSKYMHNILEVNAEEGWVKTQPGIILDELNRQISDTGMLFAPDPSTSNRGNVGGALGNNSCGAHSLLWGKTVDNVLGMDVVLSDGDRASFSRLSGDELEGKMRLSGLEGSIYREIFALGEQHREEVIRRYPKIQRRVSGYNLDEFVGGSDFNMARFVVGSEGTLLTVTEAKLKIVPKPKFSALSVIHFDNLIESMEATVAILEIEPAAVEHIGSMILRQAQSNLVYSRMTDFIIGEPDSLLVVELVGDSESEVLSKLDRLEEKMHRAGLGYAMPRLISPVDQAKVWNVRKAGLGLMMNVPGDAKPLPFVEDTAVAPEKLPEFVKRFDSIVKFHNTEAGYYGHAGVGCLHIRPLINVKDSDDVAKMVSISEEISDLVLEFGGSLSGEHGDGLVRSQFNEKMFGSDIYQAFQQVKKIYDPEGLMNPGKITDATSMTDNLRIDPSYKTIQIKEGLDFSQEKGFAGAIEMCNGQGACRKLHGGTMCPSYMVTRDETHSTRGRANALRGAMSGALTSDYLTSDRMHDVMDLCLECKGCKAECPSNVDMAKLKYEFLAKYHSKHGYGLKNRIFANIALLNHWGSFFAPISNLVMESKIFRYFLGRYVGVDIRRNIPSLASQTFVQWFRSRGGSRESENQLGRVILFPDTFTNYNNPELGKAAVKLIESMGYVVELPPAVCCGRPMLSQGMLEKARKNARTNVDRIHPLIHSDGAKLVGLEPSCILGFKDDYLSLLGDDEKAKEISSNTMLIEEFILFAQEIDGAKLDFSKAPGRVLFHGHCHQKALVGTAPAMKVLNSIEFCDPVEIDSGCCGMAGSFGMERDHYDISMDIGELSLFPSIRAEEGDFEIVTEGVSCREQILQGTSKKAKHLVEFLADCL